MSSNPFHDDGQTVHVPHTTIATFPVGTFLENIAVRSNGTLLVSSMISGEIFYVDPNASNPQATLQKVWDFNAEKDALDGDQEDFGPYGSNKHAEAIVEDPDTPDVFYTFSGINLKAGTWAVYRLDLRKFSPSNPEVEVSKFAEVPQATWLNGGTIIPFPSPRLVIAESLQGQIISCDLSTGEISTWASHTLLGKTSPGPPWPGVNGLQYFRSTLYATSSEKGVFVKIDINEKTGEAVEGSFEVVAEALVGDDLAFDEEGNAYIATNPKQTVIKIFGAGLRTKQAGGEIQRVTVVGGKNVEETAGPTAVAFGRTEKDRKSIYITTTGGLVTAVGDAPAVARIVRADMGVRGASY